MICNGTGNELRGLDGLAQYLAANKFPKWKRLRKVFEIVKIINFSYEYPKVVHLTGGGKLIKRLRNST